VRILVTKKLFALAASAAFLVPQAIEVARPNNGWYWPFLDYPMYAWSYPKGEAFRDYAFRVQGCEPGSEALPMDEQALGIGPHVLQFRLDMATRLHDPWSPDQVRWARESLSHLALARAGEAACVGEVWVQEHSVQDGVGYAASDWELRAQWDLRGAEAAASSLTGDAR
jgi:hypothetical protein